jgi:hypothetical protein
MSYVHNSHAASVWAAHRARQRALRGRAPAKGAGGLAAPAPQGRGGPQGPPRGRPARRLGRPRVRRRLIARR